MVKFKKGDIVKCINIDGRDDNELVINRIYIIKRIDTNFSEDYIELVNYNFSDVKYNGFFTRRFKKMSKEDLTSEEKFKYIKYKLGVRNEWQRQQKR